MAAQRECTHIERAIRYTDVPLGSRRCEECVKAGMTWVHLRMCAACGHVGCCDESPGKHAAAHFRATAHPIVKSAEPGEDWYWCYVDQVAFSMKRVG